MALLAKLTVSFNLLALVFCVGLNEEFTWTRINYVWPTKSRGGFYHGSDFLFPDTDLGQQQAPEIPNSIDYRYENNIPMGSNVWKDKLFISVPRRRLGVPSTLNYVSLSSRQRHNVPLTPYPDWKTNLFPSQSMESIVSVYRVAIDKCDRLWFVDTGVIEIPGNATTIKPPTLYIMDLNTDRIIHKHVFPASSLVATTSLASVTVDATADKCQDAYAYFPDLSGYGLIVYSFRENRSWRVRHNYFFLEPQAGDFLISGHRFQWNDGIFSVELSDTLSDGFRDLYFHSMAGTHMYKVSTRILKNRELATRSFHEDSFKVIGDRGSNSQTSSADIHKATGVMFLGLVNENALGCWNIGKGLKDISFVQKDNERMIYPCDVKLHKDRIYLLTNTMPEFLYGKLDYDRINFRVWSNTVMEAIRGTRCESSPSSLRGSY